MFRTSGIVAVLALAASASSVSASLSLTPYAGGDTAFNLISNNGALERAVTEGRTGTPGNWQMAIWQQGGVGSPQTQAQFGLSNGAVQPFTITFDGASTITYTANNVPISWNAVAGSFTDIFIRVRSAADSTIALGNVFIDAGGGNTLSVGNFSSTGAVPADYLRVQNGGLPLPAFTITGTHQLSWTSVNPPNGSGLAYQFKFTNVVPTPGAALVLGLGGLAAARRRRV